MKIEGAAALVTGANRGLGAAIAQALVDSGAKVYGGARDSTTITNQDVIPVLLDVNSPDDIAERGPHVRRRLHRRQQRRHPPPIRLARRGRHRGGPSRDGDELLRLDADGTRLRAGAPRNGGGALVNVLSVLSFISMPQGATYSASKAAAWSLTNALRIELRRQGTLVVAVHAGFIDTDMAAGVTGEKVSPESVAAADRRRRSPPTPRRSSPTPPARWSRRHCPRPHRAVPGAPGPVGRGAGETVMIFQHRRQLVVTALEFIAGLDETRRARAFRRLTRCRPAQGRWKGRDT